MALNTIHESYKKVSSYFSVVGVHPLITGMFLSLFLFGSHYSHIFVSLIGTELVCEIHKLSLT